MNISYLINQYPKVSHSFIRREILALERQGFHVQRIAQRGWRDTLVDAQDMSEREKTQYIVRLGIARMMLAAIAVAFAKPAVFFKTLVLAFRLRKGSDTSLIYHLVYFLEACQMQAWLKAHQSQHIHAHFGTNSSEIAMFASQLSGIPYSFTVHGPEEFDKPIALGLNQKIKLAKFVAAISSYGRSQLFRWANYEDWPKVKEVHCGLEPDFYQHAPNVELQQNQMVCVGRLCEQKGQLLLIEAMKALKDKGRSFHLVLAGDGEMRAEVESLIQQYNLESNVTITGWISSDQVRDYILSSQMLVLPSFAEGLPVVIMESMSLKRPVISTFVAGIPELVKSGENGWLCAAGDVAGLVNVIETALSTPNNVLKEMSESAYKSVVARHDINTEASKLALHIKEPA